MHPGLGEIVLHPVFPGGLPALEMEGDEGVSHQPSALSKRIQVRGSFQPIVWAQVFEVATAERPPQHRRRFHARRAAALHVMPGITNEDGLFRGYRESR